MYIENLIKEGSEKLKKNDIPSFLLDSEILLSKSIGKKREYIILNPKKIIDLDKLNIYNDLISQRALGKPIAYLIGKKEFWKNEFKISENVLIPRPDTEIIIEEILRIYKNKKKLRILDVGVGSGCIILSILNEKKDFYGIGIDISKKCIDLSRKNSLFLKLKDKVKFFKSDIDNFNYGKYDLIVSNPPYINHTDLKYLDKGIVKFEPKLALDGGIDGLFKINKVIKKSSKLIKKNGKFILEIAFDQKEKVKKMLRDRGFYINKILKDYAKKDRCIVSTKI